MKSIRILPLLLALVLLCTGCAAGGAAEPTPAPDMSDLPLDGGYAYLREESQLLRESCAQLQSLFQAEIDTRQNRIMQILTIVTTIFLPLTLLVGWYGMNFVGMPELTWKYGYPVVVVVSIVTVGISLWVCKKKKFW